MIVAHWHELAEELMRTRRRGLVAYAFLLTQDVTAAEDLVQDAVVRTFTGLRRFPSVGHAEAYARCAIASAFLDSRRAPARRDGSNGSRAVKPNPQPRARSRSGWISSTRLVRCLLVNARASPCAT